MALSGRMFHGTIPAMAVGASIVVLNEVGKSGMLRVANVMSNTGTDLLEVKLEVDGVVIYTGSFVNVFGTASYYSHGVGLASSNTNGVAQWGKILNLPFTNSIKITVTQNHTNAIPVYYSGDYVLDI